MSTPMRLVVAFCLLLGASSAGAVSSVVPSVVTVSSTGLNRALLAFRGTAGQRAVDAFWCGDITVPPGTPVPVDPCVPGTLFGHALPEFSKATQFDNATTGVTTDVMTIPLSVARRAYQRAAQGNRSTFFYVRRFENGVGVSQFIAVACRLGASSAVNTLLNIRQVRLGFSGQAGMRPVLVVGPGEKLPAFGARIDYNGSGHIRGRWELVRPGDIPALLQQLSQAASTDQVLQGLEKRFSVIGRFDAFLPPTGSFYLAGPDPTRLPTEDPGGYMVLLRFEAGADRVNELLRALPPGFALETPAGKEALAAVAFDAIGRVLPVLRYYVGESQAKASGAKEPMPTVELRMPWAGAVLSLDNPLRFSWSQVEGVSLYRLEIAQGAKLVFAALVAAESNGYSAPPWIKEQTGKTLRWRVLALNHTGSVVAASPWQDFRFVAKPRD